MFGYWALLQRDRRELVSLLICLRPGRRQGRPSGYYRASARLAALREVLRFRYQVVCAWDWTAEELLARRGTGLLPLVPFTSGATPMHVEQALAGLGRLRPNHRSAELQVALAVFAGHVFPDIEWFATIPREARMRSTTYDRILAEGEKRGQAKLLEGLLRERLGKAAEPFLARLHDASEKRLIQVARAVSAGGSKQRLLTELGRILPA